MASSATSSGASRPKSENNGIYDAKKIQINAEAQALLESYSKIPPEDVLNHVVKLRDEAFAVYHYACIGQMRFLSFNLSHMPFYPKVLSALHESDAGGFLDIGCCFGQEIRWLANEGIPHKQLYGCDLEKVFIDLGYKLFLDENKLGAKFIVGDIAQADEAIYTASPLVQELSGKMQVIFASSLLHMWDYEEQLLVVKRLVDICLDQPGVMITGRQLGSHLGGRYPMTGMSRDENAKNYRHNEQTIRGLWHEIGEVTGTQWTVETATYHGEEIEQSKNAPFAEPNMCMIWWCATRK